LVITASVIGTWPGVLVALMLSAFNLYLAQALSETWEGLQGKAAVFTVLHLLIGAGVGRWRDLNLRLRRELQERKEMEARLEHLAYHDQLTGLPNRLLFQDRLETEIAHARRGKAGLSVLFLNFDGLKSVNDSLGHEVGDRLLAEAGNRIRRSLRNSDTVARFGSETFALLLPRIRDPRDISAVVDKVMTALDQTFFVSGQEIHVKAHIGVAAFPDDGEDPETLLRNADAALNQAHSLEPRPSRLTIRPSTAWPCSAWPWKTESARPWRRKSFSCITNPSWKPLPAPSPPWRP
jgi:diguanylate cyclase (GGDEF)-like protein